MLHLASRLFFRRIPIRTRSLSSLPDGYKIRQARVWRKSKYVLNSSFSSHTPFLISYSSSRYFYGTVFILCCLHEASKKIAKTVEIEDEQNKHTYGEQWEQKHKSIKNEKEKVEAIDTEQVEENNIFIPLTWPSKRPIEPYDADSSEWQALLDLSRDQQQVQGLMSKLRDTAVAAALNTRNVSLTLGYGNVSVKQDFWVEFPQSPPQEYECSGLELSEGGRITWKARIVDVSRMRKYGLPYATAKALWTGNYSAAKAYYGQIKQTFSFRSSNSSAIDQPQAPTLSVSSSSQASPQRAGTPPSENSILSQAASTLRRTFNRSRSAPSVPVRGSCRIMGILHLSGTAGRCRLLVQGDYLPIHKAWVGINIQLYSISPNVVRPREKPRQQVVEEEQEETPSPSAADSTPSPSEATSSQDNPPGHPVESPPESSTKDSQPPPKEPPAAEKSQKEPPPKGSTAEDG